MDDKKFKEKESSFVDHLTELRSRLIKTIVYVFILFVISYTFADNIYNFLVAKLVYKILSYKFIKN